jgi:hypothetical protein
MTILKQQSHEADLTVDSIFVYLCQQEDWTSDVEIAVALNTSMPITRKLLLELGDFVENDRDGNWRIVRPTETKIISHNNDKLTIEQKKELLRLERKIESGFYLAGIALKQIREQRLYRNTHSSFEEYCRDRFDFTRAAARYLIGAAEVVDNLKCKQIVYTFPTKESQCRPLLGLTPELQSEVWLEAVKKANGKVPSARIVKSVLEQNREKIVVRHSSAKKKTDSMTQYKEGLNYKAGLGCEWNVKVEQIIYDRLKDYQELNGLPTLNSAIANLLALVCSNKEEKLKSR